MRSGKHKGKSFHQIATEDRSYCSWVLKSGHLTASFQHFAAYLRREHGGILTCGRHKWMFFDEVWETARDYCYWATSLDEPSPSMNAFAQYIQYRCDEEDAAASESIIEVNCTSDEVEEKESATKKPRTVSYDAPEAPPTLECKICLSKTIKAVFVPCGHMTCTTCGEKFEKCPFCRSPISLVVKAFLN